MGLFTKTPEQKRAQEEAERAAKSADKAVEAWFDDLARLPICVELSNLSDGERGLVNALNGMLLVECSDGCIDGPGEKHLELRTLPNATSGNYSTNFFTPLTMKEAEKLVAVWTHMAKAMD